MFYQMEYMKPIKLTIHSNEDEMRKLSSGKKAYVSSTCTYSRNIERLKEGKNGCDGPLDTDYNVHTNLEMNPWWCIDLEKKSDISEIRIFNRTVCRERFSLFSISASNDSIEWETIYTKLDNKLVGDDDGKPFVIKIENSSFRYVKIVLHGLNVLNFRRIEIFGNDKKYYGVVFSVLHNEGINVINNIIKNFSLFMQKEDLLIINTTQNINTSIYDKNENIIIFNGEKRHASGGSILNGHLESIEYILSNGMDFKYFTSLASNCIMFRGFLVKEVIRKLKDFNPFPINFSENYFGVFSIKEPPANWLLDINKNYEKESNILREIFGIEYLIKSQIEGLFAEKRAWLEVLKFKDKINIFSKNSPTFSSIPLEELLPHSIMFQKGFNYAICCYVRWENFRVNCDPNELFDIAKKLPPYINSFKWFDRDNENGFEEVSSVIFLQK